MYHVIDEARTPAERQWCCVPQRFAGQMRWLRESGCTIIRLGDLVDALVSGKTLPARAVCVTFDDGTKCLLDHALPVLQEYEIPSTAFIVADCMGGQNDWLIKEGWSGRSLLGGEDLRKLSRSGVEIGSHSATHANLSLADSARLNVEISDSKHRLEDVIGESVHHFAYPYGKLNTAAVETVRAAGYASACTVEPGWNTSTIDPMLLRRIEVFNWDTDLEFRLKVKWAINEVRPGIRAAKGVAKRLLETVGMRDANSSFR